ncbi:MAG: hypothetical protein M1831_007058 [Alyxoria varia]|nr:MAG: hypothetical protein M1831_007058 [Alyxoria varia]
MPGILPMKVIKVGSSTQQSRIAQACDRCRSKKIRCDGLRPCCTQCAQVGFECKTSDKLSRRAFPRGYTESLEERVRALETETRELKELLDARDDKIDILSRMRSQSSSRGSGAHQATSSNYQAGFPEGQNVGGPGYDAFQSLPTNSNAGGHESDIYFSGTSGGRGLASNAESHSSFPPWKLIVAGALKSKLRDTEKDVSQIDTDILFPSSPPKPLKSQRPSDIPWSKVPPRLFTDQMVNVYFQEWAPLFPIIHRPTFLAMYNEYLANNGELQDKQWTAQINLIFGIGALSSGNRTAGEIQACENQWRANLKPTLMDTSLLNLQCLILAQIFCIQKGDFSKVHLYKALAVGIAQKLGLHRSQESQGIGFLGLTYHYIRMLIHRPAVCSDVTSRYPFSFIAMASSSKHIVQILQLLDERKMCFSFCMNKNELLTLCGLGVLFQASKLGRDSRLMTDTKRTLFAVMDMLKRYGAGEYMPFKVLCNSVFADERNAMVNQHDQTVRSVSSNPEIKMSPNEREAREALQNIAHRYTVATSPEALAEDDFQPAVAPSSTTSGSNTSDSGRRFRPIAPSTDRPSSFAKSSTTPSTMKNSTESLPMPRAFHDHDSGLNLDYFSFNGGRNSGDPSPAAQVSGQKQAQASDWQGLLQTLDPNGWQTLPPANNAQENEAFVGVGHQHQNRPTEISPETWDLAGDLFEFQPSDAAALVGEQQQPSQKTGSTTSGSLASGPEDFVKVNTSTGSTDSSLSGDPGGSSESELPKSSRDLGRSEEEVFQAMVMPETLLETGDELGSNVETGPATFEKNEL